VRRALLPTVVLLLAGCGSEPSGPQDVVVEAGPQRVEAAPTQYCVDGEGQRYATIPPKIEVSPGTTVRLTVPDAVAERGWSVQVFDEGLEQLLGEVDVDAGEAVSEVNSSDVVPPTFYLVVVENAGEECDGFSGAWPIGFLRAGGAQGGTATEPTTPAPQG
jgi:Protein of unknown function (DUF2771)